MILSGFPIAHRRRLAGEVFAALLADVGELDAYAEEVVRLLVAIERDQIADYEGTAHDAVFVQHLRAIAPGSSHLVEVWRFVST